jgi:hypothetical protein
VGSERPRSCIPRRRSLSRSLKHVISLASNPGDIVFNNSWLSDQPPPLHWNFSDSSLASTMSKLEGVDRSLRCARSNGRARTDNQRAPIAANAALPDIATIGDLGPLSKVPARTFTHILDKTTQPGSSTRPKGGAPSAGKCMSPGRRAGGGTTGKCSVESLGNVPGVVSQLMKPLSSRSVPLFGDRGVLQEGRPTSRSRRALPHGKGRVAALIVAGCSGRGET